MDYNFPANNPSSCGSFTGAGETKREKVKKRSKGVMKLSTDPQSVAARERRHRISDRFKILQSLVPGGTKMDTVSMLDEAIHYVKFLKTQIWLHQTMINFVDLDHPAPAAALPLGDDILYPRNDVVDPVEMEDPFLPQQDSVNFPAGDSDDQFMCSYDGYMNF